jgi:hypothetical protein
MRNDETGEIAATTSAIVVHFDTAIRKARALPSDVRERATLMVAGRGRYTGDQGDTLDVLEPAMDCAAGDSISDR